MRVPCRIRPKNHRSCRRIRYCPSRIERRSPSIGRTRLCTGRHSTRILDSRRTMARQCLRALSDDYVRALRGGCRCCTDCRTPSRACAGRRESQASARPARRHVSGRSLPSVEQRERHIDARVMEKSVSRSSALAEATATTLHLGVGEYAEDIRRRARPKDRAQRVEASESRINVAAGVAAAERQCADLPASCGADSGASAPCGCRRSGAPRSPSSRS